ncbi:four helix bundle protein [Candidatus Desantisbacteria bacterium]|nr:four helix bundle protein [Candidatus Desantisbacteria bacterium]
MKITRFEEIDGWKEARELTKKIYGFAKKPDFVKDFGLRGQIQRASVSIMSNIAEGFDSESTKEFIRFLRFSRRSSSEVKSHLYIALDQKYITEGEFKETQKQVELIAKLLKGFINYLQKHTTP